MAQDKKGFILYTDLIHTVRKLPVEKRGEFFMLILEYVNDLDPETDDLLLDIAFEPVKQNLKRDLKKYETIQEKRREAGKKGGLKSGKKRASEAKKAKEASASKTKQRLTGEANEPVNVNVSVNESVSVSDNVKEKESEYRALNFLKINYPQRFETEFLMRHKSKIKEPKKFAEIFNDKVDTENLEYTDRILFARLNSFALRWVENQNRFRKNETTEYESGKLERF